MRSTPALRLVWLAWLTSLALPAQAQSLVAHRGASHDAPENTLAAFRLAWELGADAVEGDFYLTADERIVCIHDRDTERTAGVKLDVARATLAELSQLDVGAWKGERWRGERIPTIEQVLACVPRGKRIFIEIKCGPEIVPHLKRTLLNAELEREQIAVIAFDAQVIAEVERSIPEIETAWLCGHERDEQTGAWSHELEEVLSVLGRIEADGLDTSVPAALFDADFVAGLRAKGYAIHTYTVNDPANAGRLVRLGVDSITTDRPAFLRAHLPSPRLMDHLLVHLPFDGGLGEARSLKADAGAARFVPGVFDRALDLSSGAVVVPHALPDTGGLAFWYRTRPWYDYQSILDGPVDENQWEMWIYANGILRFRDRPGGAVVSHTFHPTGDVEEWHHVAVTWERADAGRAAVRLFLDGRLSDAAGWNGAWTAPGERFFLGGGHAGNTAGNGACDDLALFDVALTPSDVAFLMHAGVPTER